MTNPDVPMLLVALQQQPPAIPGEGGAIEPAPNGPNGAGGTTGAPPSGFSNNFFFLMLLALAAIIIFSIFGQRRERKKRDAMLSAIKKHDRVQTIGGVIGSVVEVNDDSIVLKVDEASNVRLTFARSAVQQVLSEGKGGKSA